MLAAAGKEDETTGEEEVGGGGAPGSTPALGACGEVCVEGPGGGARGFLHFKHVVF